MKLKESENYIETEDYQFIQEPEKNSLSACLSASFFIFIFIFFNKSWLLWGRRRCTGCVTGNIGAVERMSYPLKENT